MVVYEDTHVADFLLLTSVIRMTDIQCHAL